jgi:hypothetical protein
MDVKTWHPHTNNLRESSTTTRTQTGSNKVEVKIEDCVGVSDTSVILLDAEDSFDIIIQGDDGVRECIYSFVKNPEE